MNVDWKWAAHIGELEGHFFGGSFEGCDVLTLNLGLHPILYFGHKANFDVELMNVQVDMFAAELHLFLNKLWLEERFRTLPLIWMETHMPYNIRTKEQKFFPSIQLSVKYLNGVLQRVLSAFGIPIISMWEMTRSLGMEGYRDGLHVEGYVNEAKARMLMQYLTGMGM